MITTIKKINGKTVGEIPSYITDDIASNAADIITSSGVLNTKIDAHSSSEGTSHTYIDQDVTSTSSPTFSGIDVTSTLTVNNVDVALQDANWTVVSDTTELQSALDAEKKKIYLKIGVYSLATKITPYPGLHLKGEGTPESYSSSGLGVKIDCSGAKIFDETSTGTSHTLTAAAIRGDQLLALNAAAGTAYAGGQAIVIMGGGGGTTHLLADDIATTDTVVNLKHVYPFDTTTAAHDDEGTSIAIHAPLVRDITLENMAIDARLSVEGGINFTMKDIRFLGLAEYSFVYTAGLYLDNVQVPDQSWINYCSEIFMNNVGVGDEVVDNGAEISYSHNIAIKDCSNFSPLFLFSTQFTVSSCHTPAPTSKYLDFSYNTFFWVENCSLGSKQAAAGGDNDPDLRLYNCEFFTVDSVHFQSDFAAGDTALLTSSCNEFTITNCSAPSTLTTPHKASADTNNRVYGNSWQEDVVHQNDFVTFSGIDSTTIITASGIITGDNIYYDAVAQNIHLGHSTDNYTTGTDNISIGIGAGDAITSAVGNISIGTNTNSLNQISSNIVAIGKDTMRVATSSANATAVGPGVFYTATALSNCTGFGNGAGSNLAGTVTSVTLIGNSAAGNVSAASSTVAVGHLAGYNVGSNSTCIGTGAGYNAGNYCVNLGYRAGYDDTSAGVLYIGNHEDNGIKANTWIYGDSDKNVEIPNGTLTTQDTNITGDLSVSGTVTGINVDDVDFYTTVGHGGDEEHDHDHTLGHYLRHVQGAAPDSGFDLTDNADGTVTISGGYAWLRDSTNIHTSTLYEYYIPGGTTSGTLANLTDNTTNYMFANYNSGTPQIDIYASMPEGAGNTQVPIWFITRVANQMHLVDMRTFGLNYTVNNSRKDFYVNGYQHSKGGTALGETGTRNLTLTEGAFFLTSIQDTHISFNTSVSGVANENTFTTIYQDGAGGWIRTDEQKQVDNTYYDDGTGTLATIPNNKWGVHWVYLILNTPDELRVHYGRDSYSSIADAQAAQIPGNHPPECGPGSSGILVGKIIVEQGASSFVDIASPFTTALTTSTPTSHDELANIQGGAFGDYYHLTAERVAYLNTAITTSGSPTFISTTTSGLYTQHIHLDVEAEPALDPGGLYWDKHDHTIAYRTGLGNTQQVGQELWGVGINETGETVPDGRVVYATSASGVHDSHSIHMTFDYADARDGATCGFVGVTTATISGNEDGPVITFGYVRDFDTSMWAKDDKLYIDTTTSGMMTNVVPSAPHFRVWVGTVTESHTISGSIFVNPQLDYTNGVTFSSLDINDNLTVSGTITNTQIDTHLEHIVDEYKFGFVANYAGTQQTTIAFDGTNTFTLSPTISGGTWEYYREGAKTSITGDKTATLSGTAPAAKGLYFIVIDSNDGTLTASTDAWTLEDTKVAVATVAWDNALTPNYWLADERHTCSYGRRNHWEHHFADGTEVISQGALSGYTVAPSSPVDTDNTFGIGASILTDEDLKILLSTLTDPDGTSTDYVIFYRTAAPTWVWSASAVPYLYSGTYIQYDSAGTLTTGQGNKFYVSYLLLTDIDGTARFVIVPGQDEYDVLIDAQAATFSSLTLTGIPINEFVAVNKFIWQTSAAYSTKGKCRLAVEPKAISVSTLGASSTISQEAIGINVDATTFTNTLSGIDTNVQRALETLDDHTIASHSDITTTGSGLDAHIADTALHFLASEVTVIPYVYSEKINGEIYTGNLGYFVVTDNFNGTNINEVRSTVLGLPAGQSIKVDVRKNGTATTNSVFTSDVPIEIGTTQTGTNGVYQVGCNTSISTVGTAGTTIDTGQYGLSADDVLYIYVAQVGSTSTGADLKVEVVIG